MNAYDDLDSGKYAISNLRITTLHFIKIYKMLKVKKVNLKIYF